MPTERIAHVINLENRRYILQKDSSASRPGSPAFHLFSFSTAVEEHTGSFVEYWKCVHRSCGVRLNSRGTFFGLLNPSAEHVHQNSKFSTSEFLSKSKYRVERVLIIGTIKSSPKNATKSARPYPALYNNIAGNNEGVLKNLLLSPADRVFRPFNHSDSTINSSSISPDCWTPSSNTSSRRMIFRPKIIYTDSQTISPSSMQKPISYFDCLPNITHTVLGDPVCWTPPVLTPTPDGSVYSPPKVPVARIEPYPVPKVMYNPYFLFQLKTYRRNCNTAMSIIS